MAYLALYRQWRPQSFREIAGQEHVTRTLQNALLAGRVTHAYLFCGPRGTGKTTTAKVLAKALNCRQRQGAEPCNRCAGCQSINNGASMDVVEIDAASHRGIDEIRELREKAGLAPAAGDYRVYIIDEVHMLTNEAFNALLKTLEEPPAHVIFILATTEPHKVPLTILSRCQRFDFHRIEVPVIVERLREVAAGAGLTAEEKALRLIARAADGGLRDALAILDQAAAFAGTKITAGDIHQVLGTVQDDVLAALARDLAAGRAGGALLMLAELVDRGRDLQLLVRALTAYLRRLLLCKVSAGPAAAPGDGEDEPPAEQALFSREQLLHILHIFTRAEQDMKWSSQPRIMLEIALVEAARPEADDSPDGLSRRVARLEETIARLTAGKEEAAATAEAAGRPAVPADPVGADADPAPAGSTPGPAGGFSPAAHGNAPPDEVKSRAFMDSAVARPEPDSRGDAAPANMTPDGAVPANTTPGDSPDPSVPPSAGQPADPLPVSPFGGGPAGPPAPAAAAQRPPDGRERLAARAASVPAADADGAGGRPDEEALQRLRGRWLEITDLVKGSSLPVYTYLMRAWPLQVRDNCLMLAFSPPDLLFKGLLEAPENRRVLEDALASLFKREWSVRCVCSDEKPPGRTDGGPAEKGLDYSGALSLFGMEETAGGPGDD
ncbi:DNA polymerase III subunit gamma/tau [Desulfotomaculum copahuensis]|uniref:DNA-directed DNA polymerase n=1 Tax=Desulfotomaculum copahuensis TaxID=1838280 RepID=A0A1B7LIA1_9FIRM|nr:DNA polymerase III subunit gamma/tau [Desulfotomaculum copahuensis]OAT86111.1 hypothetical protein A6M21_04135 [Desulfotomaculum copahuensis]